MVSKKDASIKKGMIFAGCSYTWGQGLYYYSNLETLIDQKNPWGYTNIYTPAHHRFKESVRYPRIVARHFNSFELVHPENGGANDKAVEYWDSCFNNREEDFTLSSLANACNNIPIDHIEYDEISHVIFQLTQWSRDLFRITVDSEEFEIPIQWCSVNNKNRDRPYKDLFEKYLEDNNIDYSKLNEELILNGLNNVKKFLQKCEEHGVKTYILSWPHEFISRIQKDEWLSQRWITFDYAGNHYDCIEHMNLDNPELEIYKDYENFKIPPQDSHPSLKCNEIIAENVIRFIENKES